MADVLDGARARLARLRAGESPPPGARERHGVLVALQYDLRPADHALVRELVTRAVDDLERAGEGLDELDVLATYLLASFRDVDDCELLWRAKQATFDTQAGLNAQILYACGKGAALARARDRGAADLVEYLESCDEPLDDYWSAMKLRFPDGEPAWTEEQTLDLAAWYGDRDDAHRRLTQWESGWVQPSAEALQAQAWRWQALGEHAREAATWHRRWIDHADLEDLLRALDAWQLARAFDAAWAALRALDATTPSTWHRARLAQRAFAIAAASRSQDVFAWAEQRLAGLEPARDSVHRAAFDRALEAAEALGDSAAVARLRVR